ncbi:MAG: alpha/beta hydrolase [Stenotrophomonas rhizophila]|jgi:predicted alpha/beta-fold hydrolase|uniref:YheT family hydrolase n=1 Tax=Stenotrophomonas TaxID=40323 RepID=UPI000BA5FA47|nr:MULTISPECIES: alpha/beta fold hydrolase [Stenotrophomonas]MDF2816652.1 alpha/beta hydrolase [Stenotrophomonas rhizophila]MDQ1064388.1 putative alpha/beta-fold hydrolase [Stenotrophomonas sp. SORGH_AS_0282]MDQ1190978.1 putative alpha/beta-fold hydrolase [Stenotrophomonas sp. SORGH_AS_0282]PAK94429.1 alpha/beta hydrolase [Stenotrophomonas rhizophila]
MLTAADYCPPRWLRNPHLQSMLSSSRMRMQRGLVLLAATGALTEELILDGGEGVRLQGWHSRIEGREPVGMALLLHGWEGSSESSYMRMTAARMLEAGYDVVRLNFRDHGNTHHLNPGIFHSNRIDEVVQAAGDIARRWPQLPLVAAGYSLGGNFVLRLALRAPSAGVPLRRVASVCPVLDPAITMESIENGPAMYDWYFRRKWAGSLRRKRDLFPELSDWDDRVLKLDIRALTAWLVEHHTEFGTLQAYFDGYSIAGDRLSGLEVPADILMAQDDPVIPYATFHGWRLPAHARLEIAPWGGHCGFLENWRGDGFSERWVAQRLSLEALR